MNEIVPSGLISRIRVFFDEQGLTEAVGGPKALDEGLHQLAAGALPLFGELMAAKAADTPLADAVYDFENYPHLVRVHGFLNDVLMMDIPKDLMPWAEKITEMSVPMETTGLRQATAKSAVLGVDALAHLARFALFEALCLNQRLVLKAEGTHLEAVNGRSQDVEVIAEREVELALAWPNYGLDLIKVDDPVRTLTAAAVATLSDYIEQLRDELRALRAEVHEKLRAREKILEVMDALPADQAVLVFNECADIFGEDRIEAEDLKRHHPALLGHLGRDAIYQRVHRLPARVEKVRLEPVDREKPAKTLADLILKGNKSSSSEA